MATIVMVVGDPASLSTGDTLIRGRLQAAGHTVVLVDDDSAQYGGAYDGFLVSDSCAGSTLGTKYTGVAKPCISCDSSQWDDFGLVAASSSTTCTQWVIVSSPTPPFTGGLSGTITVYSASSTQYYATTSNLGSGAARVAYISGSSTNNTCVAYEQGATLYGGGSAPARRVMLGLGNAAAGNLASAGQTLLDAAIGWAFAFGAVLTKAGTGAASAVATGYKATGSGPTVPTVRSVSSNGAAGATTVAVTKPAGLAVGDYLLCVQMSDADGTLAAMTGPSGFSGFATLASAAPTAGSNIPAVKIWGKVATSAEANASSFSWPDSTSSDCTTVMIAITAGTFDGNTPVTAGGTWGTQGSPMSNANLTAPAMTGAAGALLFGVYCMDTGGTVRSFTDAPAGMSLTHQSTSGSSTYTRAAVYQTALGGGGTTGSKTAVIGSYGSNTGWQALLLRANPGAMIFAKAGLGVATGAPHGVQALAFGVSKVGTAVAQPVVKGPKAFAYTATKAGVAAAGGVSSGFKEVTPSAYNTPVIRSWISEAIAAGSTIAVGKPSGLIVGDYLLGFALSDSRGTLTAMTAPTGWGLLDQGPTPDPVTGVPAVKAWGKVADAADVAAASFEFPNSSTADATVLLLSVTVGTYNRTGPVGVPAWTSQGSATGPDLVATSVAGIPGALLLAAYGADTGGVVRAFSTTVIPNGMLLVGQSVAGTSTYTRAAIYQQMVSGTGPTGDKLAELTGPPRGWVAAALQVNPAPNPYAKTGIAAAGSAAGGAKTVTAAASRVKAGLAAGTSAAAGAKTVTLHATPIKAGLAAVAAAGAGAKAFARKLTKTGTAAGTPAVGGFWQIVPEGAVTTLEKTGRVAAGLVGRGAQAVVSAVERIKTGLAVAAGASKGPKTVTGSQQRVKTGGVAARPVARGPLEYVRYRSGMAASGVKVRELAGRTGLVVGGTAAAGPGRALHFVEVAGGEPAPAGFEAITAGYQPPRRAGTRVIIRDILTGQVRDWDLPLTDLEVTWTLSGPTLIKAKVTPENADVVSEQLDAWATWIDIEEDGEIRASGICQPVEIDGETMSVEAVGVIAYPNGLPYLGELSATEIDVLDVVRNIWTHLLTYADAAPLGVTLSSNLCGIRLGTPGYETQELDSSGNPVYEEQTQTVYPPADEKVTAAQAVLDRMKSGQFIDEHWMWPGCPDAVVHQQHWLINFWWDAGKPDVQPWLQRFIDGYGPIVEAARLIRDRFTSGQQMYSDWQWKNSPILVDDYIKEITKQYTAQGGNIRDSPTTIVAWLNTWIDAHKTPPATAQTVTVQVPKMTTVEAKPYEINWWSDIDCGREIEQLAQTVPFDYVERATWNADRSAVVHLIELGYPRVGRQRDDLRFALDENLLEAVIVREAPDVYASQIVVRGKGEGRDGVRGYATQQTRRVRRVATITDKNIPDAERANRYAADELRRRQTTLTIGEITVSATHPNAPLGSFAIGDDIVVSAPISYLGNLAVRHRITSFTWQPDTDAITLQLERSEAFVYGRPGEPLNLAKTGQVTGAAVGGGFRAANTRAKAGRAVTRTVVKGFWTRGSGRFGRAAATLAVAGWKIVPSVGSHVALGKAVARPRASGVQTLPAGLTAAAVFGWGAPHPVSDEFTYTGPPDPSKWSIPDAGGWPGNGGFGRRMPERQYVSGGMCQMTGLANGDTGWMQQKLAAKYGRWEIRSRSYNVGTSGNQYHPLHLLWPYNDDWPAGGEADFMEQPAPGEDALKAFIHYPNHQPRTQEYAELAGVGLQDWHNIGIEWSPNGFRGYVDGRQWFLFDRDGIQDYPYPVRLHCQLDNFYGDSMRAASLDLEWARFFEIPGVTQYL